jgi:uncharacterized coiled-coil protein SlyX
MEPVKPPMGNRVEDLEKQVAELQAAVDGLTEELVESKERLRQLEKANADEPTPERSTKRTTSKGGARDAEFVANAKKASSGEDDAETDAEADTDADEEDAEDDSDGIIVA